MSRPCRPDERSLQALSDFTVTATVPEKFAPSGESRSSNLRSDHPEDVEYETWTNASITTATHPKIESPTSLSRIHIMKDSEPLIPSAIADRHACDIMI